MNGKCHNAELLDYLTYFMAHVGEKSLENALRKEEEKLFDHRNNGAIILGELCKLGFNFFKHEVNRDLCNPIA